jgi:hypothetical protein
MNPPTATDSALTIFAQVAAIFAITADSFFAVLTRRQEDLHWAVTTGAAVLAAIAASLAIYRHLRAIWRRRG